MERRDPSNDTAAAFAQVHIGERAVGSGHPVYVIAELWGTTTNTMTRRLR